MKPRLNIHVAHDLFERVDALAKRPGVTKASVVEAALAGFFSGETDDRRDAAIIRRLDRLTRQYDKLDRNQTIISETLALFVRYWLTITPPIPEADQDAARALGKERFAYFVTQLGRHLAAGKGLVRDVLEEIEPTEADFFTTAKETGDGVAEEGRAND